MSIPSTGVPDLRVHDSLRLWSGEEEAEPDHRDRTALPARVFNACVRGVGGSAVRIPVELGPGGDGRSRVTQGREPLRVARSRLGEGPVQRGFVDHSAVVRPRVSGVRLEEGDRQDRKPRRHPHETADHRKDHNLSFHDLNVLRRIATATSAPHFLPVRYDPEHSRAVWGGLWYVRVEIPMARWLV